MSQPKPNDDTGRKDESTTPPKRMRWNWPKSFPPELVEKVQKEIRESERLPLPMYWPED